MGNESSLSDLEAWYLRDLIRGAPFICLVLGYDGTLISSEASQERGVPDSELVCILEDLSRMRGVSVHVVSSRRREQMHDWLGAAAVNLHAESGVWRFDGRSRTWIQMRASVTSWPEEVLEELLRATATLQGAFVEEKTAAVSLHFGSSKLAASTALVRLRARLDEILPAHQLDYIQGATVIEVRPCGLSKALALNHVMESTPPWATMLAFGDDAADEELFRELPGHAISIHVGMTPSIATCRLDDCRAVRAFLEEVARHGRR